MKTLPIIIGIAALVAIFGVGCSKSSSPPPTVKFLGYVVDNDGNAFAMTDIRNPGPLDIVCHLEVQPKNERGGGGAYSILVPGGGRSVKFNIHVSQTNKTSLKVTFSKTVPTSHVTVPMQ